MRTANIVALLIILIAFGVGIYFYSQLPSIVASHWNSQGQVNGYMSRFWGAFLMPFIALAMFFLFVFIPKMDPMKENIQKFRKYFDGLIILIMVFMLYLHVLTILWNLGNTFDLGRFLVPAFGALFFYMGVLTEKAQRNWFIGIRTPWTLSSDEVWNKTHQLGGKLFKISGIVAFLGIVFPMQAIYFTIVPVSAAAVILFAYSYLQYRKIKR